MDEYNRRPVGPSGSPSRYHLLAQAVREPWGKGSRWGKAGMPVRYVIAHLEEAAQLEEESRISPLEPWRTKGEQLPPLFSSVWFAAQGLKFRSESVLMKLYSREVFGEPGLARRSTAEYGRCRCASLQPRITSGVGLGRAMRAPLCLGEKDAVVSADGNLRPCGAIQANGKGACAPFLKCSQGSGDFGTEPGQILFVARH
jgi:hypothetical protein